MYIYYINKGVFTCELIFGEAELLQRIQRHHRLGETACTIDKMDKGDKTDGDQGCVKRFDTSDCPSPSRSLM